MAETPDIVEVLQRWASDYDDATWQQPSTLTKAADAIVRLRSLVERLTLALHNAHADTYVDNEHFGPDPLGPPECPPTCATAALLAEARAEVPR